MFDLSLLRVMVPSGTASIITPAGGQLRYGFGYGSARARQSWSTVVHGGMILDRTCRPLGTPLLGPCCCCCCRMSAIAMSMLVFICSVLTPPAHHEGRSSDCKYA